MNTLFHTHSSDIIRSDRLPPPDPWDSAVVAFRELLETILNSITSIFADSDTINQYLNKKFSSPLFLFQRMFIGTLFKFIEWIPFILISGLMEAGLINISLNIVTINSKNEETHLSHEEESNFFSRCLCLDEFDNISHKETNNESYMNQDWDEESQILNNNENNSTTTTTTTTTTTKTLPNTTTSKNLNQFSPFWNLFLIFFPFYLFQALSVQRIFFVFIVIISELLFSPLVSLILGCYFFISFSFSTVMLVKRTEFIQLQKSNQSTSSSAIQPQKHDQLYQSSQKISFYERHLQSSSSSSLPLSSPLPLITSPSLHPDSTYFQQIYSSNASLRTLENQNQTTFPVIPQCQQIDQYIQITSVTGSSPSSSPSSPSSFSSSSSIPTTISSSAEITSLSPQSIQQSSSSIHTSSSEPVLNQPFYHSILLINPNESQEPKQNQDMKEISEIEEGEREKEREESWFGGMYYLVESYLFVMKDMDRFLFCFILHLQFIFIIIIGILFVGIGFFVSVPLCILMKSFAYQSIVNKHYNTTTTSTTNSHHQQQQQKQHDIANQSYFNIYHYQQQQQQQIHQNRLIRLSQHHSQLLQEQEQQQQQQQQQQPPPPPPQTQTQTQIPTQQRFTSKKTIRNNFQFKG